MSNKLLSPREEILVAELMTGKSAQDACFAAGWSAKYARKNGYEIVKRSHIVEALAHRQESVRKKCEWKAQRLITQLEADREFAISCKNPMAVMKANELIGKITGIFTESLRVEIEAKPSLMDAIAAGRTRAGLPLRSEPQVIDAIARERAIEKAED